jgi:hypothetical protein
VPRADNGCPRAVTHGVGSGVARRWLGQERHCDQTADLSVRLKSEVRRFGAKNAGPSLGALCHQATCVGSSPDGANMAVLDPHRQSLTQKSVQQLKANILAHAYLGMPDPYARFGARDATRMGVPPCFYENYYQSGRC